MPFSQCPLQMSLLYIAKNKWKHNGNNGFALSLPQNENSLKHTTQHTEHKINKTV